MIGPTKKPAEDKVQDSVIDPKEDIYLVSGTGSHAGYALREMGLHGSHNLMRLGVDPKAGIGERLRDTLRGIVGDIQETGLAFTRQMTTIDQLAPAPVPVQDRRLDPRLDRKFTPGGMG